MGGAARFVKVLIRYHNKYTKIHVLRNFCGGFIKSNYSYINFFSVNVIDNQMNDYEIWNEIINREFGNFGIESWNILIYSMNFNETLRDT